MSRVDVLGDDTAEDIVCDIPGQIHELIVDEKDVVTDVRLGNRRREFHQEKPATTHNCGLVAILAETVVDGTPGYAGIDETGRVRSGNEKPRCIEACIRAGEDLAASIYRYRDLDALGIFNLLVCCQCCHVLPPICCTF